MNWKFTIYDRNGGATLVDEPVGWDADAIQITRDLSWHGVFFENQGDTFEFRGLARKLLKVEYDTYGVQGVMSLKIELKCGANWELLSHNQFDFVKYDETEGDDCFIKITTEITGEVMDLRNRLNQKVDLDTAVAFDETTALPPYTMLPFSVTLPSKGIYIQDSAANETNSYEHFLGGVEHPTGDFIAISEYGMICLGMNKQIASEIGNFYVSSTPTYDRAALGAGVVADGGPLRPAIEFTRDSKTSWIWPLFISPIVNYAEDTASYGQLDNPCQLSYRVAGSIKNLQSWSDILRLFFMRLPTKRDGEVKTDYEFIDVQDIHLGQFYENTQIDFDVSFSSDLNVNAGDRFYLFFGNYNRKTRAQVEAGTDAFEATFNTDTFFKLTNLSKTAATPCKVYAVNETLSRVAESITNNKLKVYSDYFGRYDSQPYQTEVDGCGALEVLTNGLRIRQQENKIADKTNVFALSMQDLFDGLAPIHNIGMGVEPDTMRPGFNRLRVESWEYFYSDEVIMSCIGVNKFNKRLNPKDIFSTYQFGYAKYEAEEYTGLDEFLTKRTFRTTLSQVKNDFPKISNLIASGYALEITRRKGNEDSKDWRYDKEPFIICVKRDNKMAYDVSFGTSGLTLIDIFSVPEWAIVGSTITIGNSINNGLFTISAITPVVGFGLGINLVELTTAVNESITIASMLINNINVELGNVLAPQNIIDPETLYNFRISPIRNAMRWMNKVLASYKQFNPDAKIIFTDGAGNYYAKGKMESAMCRLENDAVSEDATIDLTLFVDNDKVRPFLSPERVLFEFPMTLYDYRKIKANPKGRIYYECKTSGYGWIDTVNYKAEQGIATFNLIPQII